MTTFLGTGAMGTALAVTLLDAGLAAVVWNRDPRRAQRLAGRGALVADTVEKAIAGDGPVVVCLFDHRSVHDVLDPAAAALAGRAVINLTTTTPAEARELAAWAAGHDIAYLDGAILAVPDMIGGPGSAIFYSGSQAVFAEHRGLLDRWGESSFFGADAGLAPVHDMAMLTGMYTMVAGFLHGAAMLAAEGVPAVEFARLQAPFLAAMTGGFAGYAAAIDAGDYTGDGQSLRFTEAALGALLRASTGQGVSTDLLRPLHDLVRRQITDGHGDLDTARIFEELRSAR